MAGLDDFEHPVVVEPTEGLRFDAGKPSTELLPPDALLWVAAVALYGKKKYAARNWEKGMPWSKVYGPLLRHTFYWMLGEVNDRESKLPHVAHIAWNGLALCTLVMRKKGTDDRGLEEIPADAVKAMLDQLVPEVKTP